MKHLLNLTERPSYKYEVHHRTKIVTRPYEDLLTTVKSTRSSMAMSADQTALPRPYSKALCLEPEEEEGNVRGGKTTSNNGQAYLSLNYKLLPKIECNGKLLKKVIGGLNNPALNDRMMIHHHHH